MADWQSYLDFVREDETLLLSSSRLLTTTTTTEADTAPGADTAPPAPLAGEHPLSVEQTGQQGETYVQNVESVKALPERAEPSNKARNKPVQSPRPATDAVSAVIGPAGGRAARDGSGTALPANWQELDPHAYQPRPFGPMETDPDWPGEQDDEAALPSLVPPASSRLEAGGTRGTATAGALAGLSVRQVDARGGLALAPPAGDLARDLEDTCWLCEDEAECYDPSGQAWCSFCVATAGKSMGWQDLVDLLPAAWRKREESHRQLAVYAAAHYHGAGRRWIALRWTQPPFHQRLKGADLFRAIARWLAAPERWKQREAEKLLERLIEHQGLGV